MSTTTPGTIVFTATATLGSVFETQLPTEAPSSGITLSILSGGVDPIHFNPNQLSPPHPFPRRRGKPPPTLTPGPLPPFAPHLGWLTFLLLVLRRRVSRSSKHSAIQLLIVQLVIIIALSRGLSYLMQFLVPKMKQPRVVWEILAGILLGPTAFGQIPGFTDHVFPKASLPFINLLATIGLVLFLFVIGLEVDFTLFRRNLKPSVSVSLAGLVIPFALGAAVSVGLYNEFIDRDTKFTTFLCFIATSSSITAFPVLGRILVDLKLMNDPVGVVVLASGVANDVIGWILLALCIALATASSSGGGGGGTGQLVVLWILFVMIGWALFLYFVCRPLLNLIARKTGSYSNPDGPTQTYMLAVLMLVFVSAWFLLSIGVSEILGGFMVGLIVPNQLGHHIAAKIEDLCICIFIPLYFAYSGLRTNLTLLNSGIIWGWVVCVVACAFCGKFLGCFFASRLTGFSNRESAAVGSLMAAKGLIELIILNQGLSVGIINEKVFSIFVLEALLLTFAATPLTLLAYPPHIRRGAIVDLASSTSSSDASQDEKKRITRPDQDGQGDGAVDGSRGPTSASTSSPSQEAERTRFTVVLDKIESLGALFVLTHLLSGSGIGRTDPPGSTIDDEPPSEKPLTTTQAASEPDEAQAGIVAGRGRVEPSHSTISIHPLRLIELTERLSGVLLASDAAAEHLRSDPLTSLYRTFVNVLFGAGVGRDERGRGGVQVAPEGEGQFAVTQSDNFAQTVSDRAERNQSQMVVVPWTLGTQRQEEENVIASYLPNPFEHIFGNTKASGPSSSIQPDSSLYASFLRDLFASAHCDVSIFFDRAASSSSPSPRIGSPAWPLPTSTRTRVFLPFFGGSDDRACLEMAVQLATRSPLIDVTVVAIQRAPEETEDDRAAATQAAVAASSSGALDNDSKSSLGMAKSGSDATGSSTVPLQQQHGPSLQLTVGNTGGGTHHSSSGGAGRAGETVYPTQHGLASETEDDLVLERARAVPRDALAGSLEIRHVSTVSPLRTMLRLATALSATDPLSSSSSPSPRARLVILLGRSRRDAASHRLESLDLLKQAEKDGSLGICASTDVRRCLGESASAVLSSAARTGDNVWIVQSGKTGGRRNVRTVFKANEP
ncbi:hypothetical protein JCM10212_004220 [Sporobolomyces blumeae]